jgi:hypothetical protein
MIVGLLLLDAGWDQQVVSKPAAGQVMESRMRLGVSNYSESEGWWGLHRSFLERWG